MGTVRLPEAFKRSYADPSSFPLNLVHKASYFGAQQAYVDRLNDASLRIFTQKNDAEVPFRDLLPSGQGFIKRYIIDDVKLKDWLGDGSVIDPNTATLSGELATKADPRCRFIFVGGKHSRSCLRITRPMLLRILSYHQVIPSFIDMISIFGSQLDARELRFSGFREQTLLSNPPQGLIIPDLGRSGKQFQLCYHLKTVNCTSPVGTSRQEQRWSIRPATFYHQFDVVYGTSLWIVAKGEVKDIKEKIENATGIKGRPEDRAFGTPQECLKSTLSIHLLHCNWSTETWRDYMQWLEYRVDITTDLAVFGPRTFDGGNQVRREYTPKDLQVAQFLEDKVNEAIMVIESNIEVLTQLSKYYEGLVNDAEFPLRQTCANDIRTFSTQLGDMIYDLKIQIGLAKLLVRTTSDRKILILQHLQSQATDKMENLTLSMHREAIAVRIITVVTLIYLPATFVSTFFSTDVIKYQSGTPNESFSLVALVRWLQVTLPLTALTLGIGYAAFKMEDIKRRFTLPNELPLFSRPLKTG